MPSGSFLTRERISRFGIFTRETREIIDIRLRSIARRAQKYLKPTSAVNYLISGGMCHLPGVDYVSNYVLYSSKMNYKAREKERGGEGGEEGGI